jgi:protein AIR1/2
MDNYDDCDRCGASIHKTNVSSTRNDLIYRADIFEKECPTWWRMYEYVSDKERRRILQVREEKKHFGLGQGGEGYIGGDECCYNCGGAGHWGDVSMGPISL